MQLPETFLKNLHDAQYNAKEWLETLPSLLETLAYDWQIRVFTDSAKLPRLSYNLVMFAEGFDGTSYVLKMSPVNDEFIREVAAINLYNGDGMAKVFRADTAIAAMLLEKLEPGISLWDTTPENAKHDDQVTRIIATLMQRL